MERELSNQWLEAYRLREEKRTILKKNGFVEEDLKGLDNKLVQTEEEMFAGADERIDNYFRELKRGDNLVRKGE